MALGQTSIDEEEVAKFSAMAAEWWDPHGKFAPLHKFNPTRLEYIRDVVVGHYGLDDKSLTPFEGLRFLDIGCGGGLLSEPMTRLGAQVVGADASEANIKTAMTHAAEQALTIDYRATTAEALADAGEQFDVILNMEVIEHVKSPRAFLASCAQLLKPGGIMLVATLNRTPKALLTAKIGAEYILGWLPRGTHDWTKFITPQEMDRYLKFAGLQVTETCGVVYKPFGDEWVLSPVDLSVNYMAVAEKPA